MLSGMFLGEMDGNSTTAFQRRVMKQVQVRAVERAMLLVQSLNKYGEFGRLCSTVCPGETCCQT